jgi:hypothetical protein
MTNNGVLLVNDQSSLKIGGIQRNDQILKAVETPSDGTTNDPTFAETKNGGSVDINLALTIHQSTKQGSLYRWIRDNPGLQTTAEFAPYGNEVANADQVVVKYNLTLPTRAELGTTASYDSTRATVDVECKVIDKFDDYGTGQLPAISTATPNKVAGGVVTITGHNFTKVSGASGVQFGSKNAADYNVEDDGTIAAVIPSGVTGATSIKITNDKGASDPFAYTAG